MNALDYLYARQRQVREDLAKERKKNPGMNYLAAFMELELMQIYEDINRLKGRTNEQKRSG